MSGPRITAVLFQNDQPITFRYQMPAATQQLAPLPWSTLQNITLRFDTDVFIRSEDLDLVGAGSATEPSTQLFEYDPESNEATWTLAEPLPSGQWQLTLSDRVIDQMHRSLDGEWWNGHSSISGNGLPGGVFKYRFNVQVGDTNQDGKTTVQDHALVARDVDSAFADSLRDIDLDGNVTASDLAKVERSFGTALTAGQEELWLEIESLNDFDDNGTNELVALRAGDSTTISRIEIETGSLLASAKLNASFRFLDVEPIADGSGTIAGAAILGVHRQTGGTRVWIWDLVSSRAIHSIAFGRGILARDLEVAYDVAADDPMIALLGQHTSNDSSYVMLANANSTSFHSLLKIGNDFGGLNLEFTNTLPTPELAVLGTVRHTGGLRAKVFDRLGSRGADFSFGRVQAIDFEVVATPTGDVFALLRDLPYGNSSQVDLRKIDGSRQALLRQSFSDPAIDLVVIREGAESQVAILTENSTHHERIAYVSRLTGTSLPEPPLSFGSGSRGYAAVTVQTSEGSPALAVPQYNEQHNFAQVMVRQTVNARRVRTIPIAVEGTPYDWFTANRVHGHTRLSMVDPRLGLDRSYYDTDESLRAAELFRELGANVFTRHTVTMDEDPWWPSEHPNTISGTPSEGHSVFWSARDNRGIPLDDGENLVQTFVNEAWSQEIPMLAYYWASSDASLASDNPDWVCQDTHGEPIRHSTKGDYLDITGSYAEVVEERLFELADMGAAGVYLDGLRLPPNGCWQTSLASEFTEHTGIAAPPLGDTPEYGEFIWYEAQRWDETIRGWRETISKEYPHFKFVVSVSSVPGLTRREVTTLRATIDSPKTEFNIPRRRGMNNSVFVNNPDLYQPADDVLMAFGWTLLRDAAGGNLPHVWEAIKPNGEHLQAFLSAVITYGSIASLDVVEELLLPDGQLDDIATRDEMAAGFELGSLASPHLESTSPVRWAAVHFSEDARNAQGLSARSIWETVNLPTVGAFESLQRAGRPVGIVTDDQLANGISDEYQVLLLPTADRLSEMQTAAVQDFISRGGSVVANDATWDWTTESGYRSAITAISQELAAITGRPSVEILGLPAGVHAVGYQREGRTVVAITNDFTFVQSSTVFDPIPAEDVLTGPAAVAAGVTIVLSGPTGTGFSIEALTDPANFVAYEAVSGRVLDLVAGDEGLAITLPEFDQLALVVVEPF